MRKILVIVLLAICTSSIQAQMSVGGVDFKATENFEGKNLLLNGAGIREKLWIDLYAAGLYLDEKTQDAQKVITADKPMALRLHIVSKLISSDKMVEAVKEGFENSTGGQTEPIQKEIDQILSFFQEDIKKDDVFDLVYLPEKGVVAYKNGVKKGVVPGKDFKKALFGIWLSNRPADDDLKDHLLAAD